jgi:hypothetical protein
VSAARPVSERPDVGHRRPWPTWASLLAAAVAACGGGQRARTTTNALVSGDAPPRLYLASHAPPASGLYVGYGAARAAKLTVVDQDGVVAMAKPASPVAAKACSSWTLQDQYAVTREVRTGPVELVLQCRPGVDQATCAAARDKFWDSLHVPCPDDTCDAAGNPTCFYDAAACSNLGAAYQRWYQRKSDRVAAASMINFGFQQTVVAQGLKLPAAAHTVDPAAVVWTTAPAGRTPYLAIDADGDGQADVVTDTVAAGDGALAYDTWVRAAGCADLAHGGWCRVGQATVVLCGAPQ